MYAHARCMHTGLACPRVRWACVWASDLQLGRAESCGRQAAGECCQRLLEHCIHEWRPALAGQQRTQPDADGARRACLVACGRQAAGECCQRFCQRLHRLNIAASECLVIWELHLRAPRGSVRGEHRAPRGERNPTCAPDLCAQPVRPTCVCVPFAQPVYVFPSPTVSLPYAPNATLHASYMRRYTRRHTRRHARRHARRHTQRHTRARSNSRGCHTARRPFPVTIPTHPQRPIKKPSPIVGGFYAEVALQKREAEAQ